MKLIILFGPPAVGKMTVGQELARITELKLFHNHMSIELARNFFDFSTPAFNRLVSLFRFEIFKEVANSELDGLIFTFVWAFGLEKEEAYVDRIVKIFKDVGAEVYYVELEASLDTRLERNRHEHRLQEKPSKRDVEHSERQLLKHEQHYRFNTQENEFKRTNYLKINNDDLSSEAAAAKIKSAFHL